MYVEEMFGLKGKVAIVTGGSQGIGQVIALGLAQAGAEVAIICRSQCDKTIKMIEEAGGVAYWAKADVTNEDEVNSAVDTVLEKSGRIDILFNNAGICMHEDTLDSQLEDWKKVIDVNLTGEYIMAKKVGRWMIENKVKGNIVNMASMSGTCVNVPQWQASYNASKAGVIHLSKSLAIEWAQYGIKVNSLSPGYIATEMATDTPQELRDAWLPLMPMGRMGEPEELIPAILYMVSDAAGYTTGVDVIVDGGYSAR